MDTGRDGTVLWVSRDPVVKDAFRITFVSGDPGGGRRTLRAPDSVAAETTLINFGASITQAVLAVAKASLKGNYSISIDVGEKAASQGVPKNKDAR